MGKWALNLMVAVTTTIVLSVAPLGFSQTASTGALTGTVMDVSAARIPGVEMKVTNEATGEVRSVVSNENGVFVFPLIAPGSYRLEAGLTGFKTAVRSGVRITVTETARLDVQLELGNLSETVTVEASAAMVQQETSTLGGVVNETVVRSLPLATRNFTQILALSTGVVANVNNAASLGRGPAGPGIVVNGSKSMDNNFQIDGADTNDSTQTATPGTAIPNPDTIGEFKVQTAQADASSGRNAGANINIVTKSGTNEFHGTLFEFFRNEALNANDFFFNRSGQAKPVVRQNQFGGTFGGPIQREKLLFFGAYQRTQQAYGVGGNCNRTFSTPPLTNDRSAAALGALFAGQRGAKWWDCHSGGRFQYQSDCAAFLSGQGAERRIPFSHAADRRFQLAIRPPGLLGLQPGVHVYREPIHGQPGLPAHLQQQVCSASLQRQKQHDITACGRQHCARRGAGEHL